ncbi:MAG: diphthine--ammonia ligase [Candidatus Micrarchaeota archaeon]
MKSAVLFSGGKDSAYATQWALEQGHEVIWVNMQPQEDSMMFHHPNVKWCKLQSQAAEIELKTFDTKHERELIDLENALKKLDVEGVVTGAVASVYQKSRIDKIANKLKLEVFSPLWGKDEEFLKKMLSEMEVYIVSISAEGLGEEWLGKKFEKEDVDKLSALQPKINVYLEGGEGETFVADAPFFKKRIEILKWEKKFDGMRGKAVIKEAKLVEK